MAFVVTFRRLIAQSQAIKRYIRRAVTAPDTYLVGREPAFDPETKAWFIDRLASVHSYLEYGAGASTLLVADRGIPAISIESDTKYACAVRRAMPAGCENPVADIDIGTTEEWGFPLWNFPTQRAIRRWQSYPLAGPELVARLPVFPDLILIDGRFRVACCLAMTKAAIEEGKNSLILFDDYVLRTHYHSVEDVLGSPQLIGRSALFAINPHSIAPHALDAALQLAISDYR